MQKYLLLALVRLLVGAYPSGLDTSTKARQSIYFSNHTSHLDTIVILSALALRRGPLVRPVAALDYWGKGPIRRHIAQAVLRVVLIDRKIASGRDPLDPLCEALEQGESLIIFPEGTRGDNATPEQFRSGLHSLATRFPNVDLVPVYLENLNRIMPKGAALPVPLISRVYFGQPLPRLPNESKATFLARARNSVINLYSR